MLDIGFIVSAGALLISFWLAFLQWRRYVKDKQLAYKADMIHDFKAPAERDAIIIAGAQEVVAIQRLALTDCTKRLDEYEKRVRHLEYELAKIKNEGKP